MSIEIREFEVMNPQFGSQTILHFEIDTEDGCGSVEVYNDRVEVFRFAIHNWGFEPVMGLRLDPIMQTYSIVRYAIPRGDSEKSIYAIYSQKSNGCFFMGRVRQLLRILDTHANLLHYGFHQTFESVLHYELID